MMRLRAALLALVAAGCAAAPNAPLPATSAAEGANPAPSVSSARRLDVRRAPESAATAALDYASMNNAFAVRLYGVVSGEAGNVFFSPLSISTALAMAYAGASGKTAREMEQALSFTLSGDGLHRAVDETLTPILESGAGLRLANRLWPQAGLPLEKPFLMLMNGRYRAPVEQLDFRAAAEPSRSRINAWVSERTNQKIPELLAEGAIDASTTMVLTNAVYFVGVWQQPFQPAATRLEAFTTASGAVVPTPLMHQKLNVRYAETPDAQIIELPYDWSTQGPRLVMNVVLPKAGATLAAVEKNRSAPESTPTSAGSRRATSMSRCRASRLHGVEPSTARCKR